MRKLTYFIACSADGFISRNDGAIDDFSFDGEHVADLLRDFPETIPTHLREPLNVDGDNQRFDTVLMGRHTYEVGLALGITSPYQHLHQFVFSSTIRNRPDADVTLVPTDAVNVVRELKAQPGMEIWLCGGSVLASALFDEIDQIVVKSNPFLMGAGKPLFSSEVPKADLRLIDRKSYKNGFALISYEIAR